MKPYLRLKLHKKPALQTSNLDLMFGLPDQTSDLAMNDLKQALTFKPPHLSWYQLTIEPNTAFYKRPPPLPATGLIDRMQEQGISMLANAGLERYEISAFSQSGQQASIILITGNLRLPGIGVDAHGKISLLQEQKIVRTRKSRQPQSCLDASKNIWSILVLFLSRN